MMGYYGWGYPMSPVKENCSQPMEATAEEYDAVRELDLLSECIKVRGHNEEFRMCIRAMEFVRKQSEENKRLRAALKPFADIKIKLTPYHTDPQAREYVLLTADLPAAAAALKETGDE